MIDKKDALTTLTDSGNYWVVNWRIVQLFGGFDEAIVLAYLSSQQRYWSDHHKLEFCTFPFIDPESEVVISARNRNHKEATRRIHAKTEGSVSGYFFYNTTDTMKKNTSLNPRRQKQAIDHLNILYRKLLSDAGSGTEWLIKHPALIMIGYKDTPPKRYISIDQEALELFLSLINAMQTEPQANRK